MSSYFYSEELTYCQCIIPREIGWEVINQLGEQQCVHFEQDQINYDNPYTKNLKRCDQAISKLKNISNFIKDFGVRDLPDNNHRQKSQETFTYKQFIKEFNKDIERERIHGYLYINRIEDEINHLHEYLWRQKKQIEGLEKDMYDKVSQLALFSTLLNEEQFQIIARQKNLLDTTNIFDYKCIIMNRKDKNILQKGLFRISRGHCWMKSFDIDPSLVTRHFPHNQNNKRMSNSLTQFLSEKVACIIMFQFGENNMLLNKINRYLSCIQVATTSIAPNKWQQVMKELENQIKQIQNIQTLTHDAIQRYLYKLYQPYGETGIDFFRYLEVYTAKERQIYKRLATMKQSKNFLHFNLFIPKKCLPLKLNLPESLPPIVLNPKQSKDKSPSKFPTSEIMEIPQQILNTYGVPSYNQLNPAPFYIVTFAFFIGVMFGDVGHMLMAIPMLLYLKVNKWVWITIFFMGYCGVIYGEFLGLSFGFSQSCYKFPVFNETISQSGQKATRIEDCVYPLGLDPIWKNAQNQMQFINSFKMKFAVVIGVLQMMLGLCIKIKNQIRKRQIIQLLLIGIPQFIFMAFTFLYMDFLIIYKWNKNYSGENSKNAPSIIATMISVYAGFGDSDLQFWQGQRKLQSFIVTLAYLMVPIMLLGVPIYTWLERRKKNSTNLLNGEDHHGQFNDLVDQKISDDADSGSEQAISQSTQNGKSKKRSSSHHQEQELSQIFVHSFIETIQYVLGAVSNTASYLRLWALSLAHGQLSEVIFTLILKSSISGGYSKIIPAFLSFIFYYSVTFGVLICMDCMQCFLHSLRLHWVQFQNKFYEGKGFKYQQFSYKNITKGISK